MFRSTLLVIPCLAKPVVVDGHHRHAVKERHIRGGGAPIGLHFEHVPKVSVALLVGHVGLRAASRRVLGAREVHVQYSGGEDVAQPRSAVAARRRRWVLVAVDQRAVLLPRELDVQLHVYNKVSSSFATSKQL